MVVLAVVVVLLLVVGDGGGSSSTSSTRSRSRSRIGVSGAKGQDYWSGSGRSRVDRRDYRRHHCYQYRGDGDSVVQ